VCSARDKEGCRRGAGERGLQSSDILGNKRKPLPHAYLPFILKMNKTRASRVIE